MSKKQKRNLEAISRIDNEIVDKASQERSNLLLALKKRIKKAWIIRGGAMAASLALIATTVLLVVLLAKEVPVYTGMTVSNYAPAATASATLPTYLDSGNGNGNAYGNKHLAGDHTDADKTIGDQPFETPIGDAVGAFHVQSAEPRYYAKPNEDVYITVHIDNPDNFVILSFTLNGKMYSSYMFEEGSDLENLILKVNVGEVEGMVSYTIDAIKYVDGTKIKDVEIGGERTVEIGVYTEKQPAAAFSDLEIGFNSISFAVDVSDTKNLFETLTGSVEAVLYNGDRIVARKDISATGKTTVTFEGLATGALYECAIIATYDAFDGEGVARHILSTYAAYTKSIVLFDRVEIGTNTLSFAFLWDQAFATKTVMGLALYQNDTKVRDIDVSATIVGDLISDTTYTLVATYQNGSAEEQISITFTTDALFVTVNQYLEELDGTYTLFETVTETVEQGTVYTPALGSHVGFTTPTVEPVAVTDCPHTFECYFERTAYEVTFHYNSAQGIVTESIKFGKPLATPTREGFAFEGWYLDAALTTPAGDTMPAKPISVYAKWLTETSTVDFSYEINEGKVTITDGQFLDVEQLVIPAYIGGYPVTAIAWNGQRMYYVGVAYGIVSVTIPDTVTAIGKQAFNGWRQLASITIPASVTTIGRSAFSDCSGLTSITIPDSVTTLGYYAFSGCSGLTSITISDSITSIADNTFYACTSL
ncbi:MAG: leucine-rich repeat protein, partial [Clostridia bacterium]|nr:leucine-rich repeat protein [Clostridia bacterium]